MGQVSEVIGQVTEWAWLVDAPRATGFLHARTAAADLLSGGLLKKFVLNHHFPGQACCAVDPEVHVFPLRAVRILGS